MDLIVICGFLGSGKTSVLLPLARSLTARGRSVAIIENEVGQAGVDDGWLKSNDLPVREIYGGCICCSLGPEMVVGIKKLREQYDPDVVLVEPSGVASPDLVAHMLEPCLDDDSASLTLVLIDPTRLKQVQHLSIEFVKRSVQVADLIAINKVDLVDASQLASIEQGITEMNAQAHVVPIAAARQRNLDVLFALMHDQLESGRENPCGPGDDSSHSHDHDQDHDHAHAKHDPGHGHHDHHHDHEHDQDHHGDHALPAPAALSRQVTLSLASPLSPQDCVTELSRQVVELTHLLQDRGATLIGHIKILVRLGADKVVLIRATRFDQAPDVVGMGESVSQEDDDKPDDADPGDHSMDSDRTSRSDVAGVAQCIEKVHLTVNVIAFGVGHDVAEQLLDQLGWTDVTSRV